MDLAWAAFVWPPKKRAGCGTRPNAYVNTELIDLLQESVVLRERTGVIVAWNSASERLYGWHREDAIGKRVHELLQTHADTVPSIENRLSHGLPWEGDVARRAATGVIVTVRLRCTPNGPDDIVETATDVSAQRRLEEALTRAENRYYNVFQAMAVSFWELDFTAVGVMITALTRAGVDLHSHLAAHPELIRDMIRATRVLDINDQSVKLFGRGNKSEMLGSLERYWPEASYGIYAASVIAAVEGRSHYATETRLSSIDGREFDVWFTASFPPDMLARGKLLIGIIDISADKDARSKLETSELRYRGLFHFLPVAMVQLDRRPLARIFATLQEQGVRNLLDYFQVRPDFFQVACESVRVVEVNGRAVELFGAQYATQLMGSATRIWGEAREAIQLSMAAAFSGEKRFETEMKIRTFTNEIREVLYVADFPNVLGETTIGLSCFVDISERVKAQSMLAHVQAEFSRTARISMLGELTASIAHEINQPLCAILNNSEAATRWLDRHDPDLSELRALALRNVADAHRAADIIHRIRAMAARRPPAHASITLDSVIDDVMILLGPELRRKGVITTLDLAAPAPKVLADRIQLQQVFANLIINAIQAMVADSNRRLLIRTSCRHSGQVYAEVEDTGPGVPRQNLPRLFESFFSTKEDGIGLGLAICRSIIESHGGRIEAGNRPEGRGARFYFTLPMASGD